MKSYEKKIISNRKIILWGASMYGEIAYKVLTEIYDVPVFSIIDNRYRKVDWTDKTIIRSYELEEICDADILICAASSFKNVLEELQKYYANNNEVYDICELLKEYEIAYRMNKNNILNSYLYGDIDLEEIIERYKYYAGKGNGYEKKIYLPYCVLCITTRCTLKCKDCAAFITKNKDKRDYSLRYVRENFGRILDAIDGITELELMGGEPFLCKEFNEILSWCIQQKKIRAIKIVTNGTLLPSVETWSLLKNIKVKLVIDDYGKYSVKLERLIEKAKEEGVLCVRQNLQSWFQILPIEEKNFSDEKLDCIFEKCVFGTCIGMTNGRLYRCNVAGQMNLVGLLPDDESDYIQIKDREWSKGDLREEISNFLKLRHIKACNYCSLFKNVEIPVAEQLR